MRPPWWWTGRGTFDVDAVLDCPDDEIRWCSHFYAPLVVETSTALWRGGVEIRTVPTLVTAVTSAITPATSMPQLQVWRMSPRYERRTRHRPGLSNFCEAISAVQRRSVPCWLPTAVLWLRRIHDSGSFWSVCPLLQRPPPRMGELLQLPPTPRQPRGPNPLRTTKTENHQPDVTHDRQAHMCPTDFVGIHLTT